MPDTREQIILEVFAYAERFRNSVFVIRIADEIIDSPVFSRHARDLALLRKAGVRIVVIPGARRRIDEILSRYGTECRFADGIRISPPGSMDLIKTAAFDSAHRVMTALSGHQVTAVIGNWVRARSRGVVGGIDFERTGLVDRVSVEAVLRSLDQGHVPIFPCIGHNAQGEPFNLASNEIAVTIAGNLHAAKLFFMTAYPVMRTPEWTAPDDVEVLKDGRIFRVTPDALTRLIGLNPNRKERNLLQMSADACRGGTDRVHILDGRHGGVLLKETFSNLGSGTMVFADSYERIRQMEAADVPGVLGLMQPLIAAGVLVERNREELKHRQNDYWVYAMDGVIHGCAALHHFGDSAEIAGVAVDPKYMQLGIGAKLIARLVEKAVEEGCRQVFVLTTQTADWFKTKGFKDGSTDDLPPERLEQLDTGRNSRILIRDLGPRSRQA